VIALNLFPDTGARLHSLRECFVPDLAKYKPECYEKPDTQSESSTTLAIVVTPVGITRTHLFLIVKEKELVKSK